MDVTNATWVDPVALVAVDEVDPGMPSTGRDDKLYPYVLTITPKYENKNDIVVKVKAFEDMVLPSADAVTGKYTPETREADYTEGEDKLTIKVGKEVLKDLDCRYCRLYPREHHYPERWIRGCR